MARLLGLFGVFLLLAPLQAMDLEVQGVSRHYLLEKPEGQGPWPTVIALHGGGGTSEGMERLTSFMAFGRRQGFAVVYPDALERHWNDGRKDASDLGGGDDEAFLLQLCDRLVADGLSDPKALYLCGISNGGMMTLRMAAAHPDRFAAVGVVAMSMSAAGPYPGTEALPICFINGDKDPLVPYEGGDIRLVSWGRSRGKVIPVQDSIKYWVARDGAATTPETRLLPHDPLNDESRAELSVYAPGPSGAEVRAYRILGGGHTWPGGFQYLGVWIIGRTNRDIDADEELWNFFRRFHR